MKYCSRHNIGVMVCLVLREKVAGKFYWVSERWLIAKGYEWKQLVLPGFDKIMGV